MKSVAGILFDKIMKKSIIHVILKKGGNRKMEKINFEALKIAINTISILEKCSKKPVISLGSCDIIECNFNQDKETDNSGKDVTRKIFNIKLKSNNTCETFEYELILKEENIRIDYLARGNKIRFDISILSYNRENNSILALVIEDNEARKFLQYFNRFRILENIGQSQLIDIDRIIVKPEDTIVMKK